MFLLPYLLLYTCFPHILSSELSTNLQFKESEKIQSVQKKNNTCFTIIYFFLYQLSTLSQK